MAIALPIAMFAASAVKSYVDSENAKSGDAAMQRAAAAKLAAMRQGAQQIENYRQGYAPQRLQAMQNQMGAYGNAQNVLSQMYGGRQGRIQRTADAVPGFIQARRAQPGMPQLPMDRQAPPGAIGGPLAPGSAPMPMPDPMLNRMGFGGEQQQLPMPIDLIRRRA